MSYYTPCNLEHAMQDEEDNAKAKEDKEDERAWAKARKRAAEQFERDEKRRVILKKAANDKHMIVLLNPVSGKVLGWRKL